MNVVGRWFDMQEDAERYIRSYSGELFKQRPGQERVISVSINCVRRKASA